MGKTGSDRKIHVCQNGGRRRSCCLRLLAQALVRASAQERLQLKSRNVSTHQTIQEYSLLYRVNVVLLDIGFGFAGSILQIIRAIRVNLLHCPLVQASNASKIHRFVELVLWLRLRSVSLTVLPASLSWR